MMKLEHQDEANAGKTDAPRLQHAIGAYVAVQSNL